MSDLISRSELIKLFKEHMRTARDFREIIINIIPTIKNQPTAYDIDKVINELESFVKLAEDRLVNGTSKYAYQERKCWVKAIEIVKQGGVYDDVCEWELTDTRKVMPYKTSCGNEDLYDNSYKYCPYCGKRIKVIGD